MESNHLEGKTESESAMKLAEDNKAARAQTLNTKQRRIRTSSWSDENKRRLVGAERALRFYLKDERDPATAARNLLSDLRHYCDACRVSYREQDEVADRRYAGQVLELI